MGKTKKFPKRPEDLWKKKTSSPQDLVAFAKAMKSQQDKEERRAKKGLAVKIMREE